MTKETIDKLKKIAEVTSWTDDPDFRPDDYAAGNIDDAFYGGVEDGRIALAREILEAEGIQIGN